MILKPNAKYISERKKKLMGIKVMPKDHRVVLIGYIYGLRIKVVAIQAPA